MTDERGRVSPSSAALPASRASSCVSASSRWIAQIEQVIQEMTQALSVGEFFNPSLRFADGRGAVLDWRDRLTALLVRRQQENQEKGDTHVDSSNDSEARATGGTD